MLYGRLGWREATIHYSEGGQRDLQDSRYGTVQYNTYLVMITIDYKHGML